MGLREVDLPVNPQNAYPETKDGKFPEDWQYVLIHWSRIILNISKF
jgi:hypothetical protein